jgi:rubredoxin
MFTKKRLIHSYFKPINNCSECGWVLDTHLGDPLCAPPYRSICPDCGSDTRVGVGRLVHEVTCFMGIPFDVRLVGWEPPKKETPDLADRG